MARYYRGRTRTIVRAPKKKWGSNMIGVDLLVSNTEQATSNGYHAVTLAANKSEVNAPTPVIVKTGNFKLQGDLRYVGSGSGAGASNATLYIVFVPQGMEPTNYVSATALVNNHPEWIMAWRYLESSIVVGTQVVDTNRFSVSSRLKRNLNSGDSIFAILVVSNLPPGHQCGVQGMCQFWTCAN